MLTPSPEAPSSTPQTSLSRKRLHSQTPAQSGPQHSSAVPPSEQFRSIMRLVPHSVVVCTSTLDSTVRAMTMSSFTSLTLTPTPLVTFNIATPSRTLDAISASRHFNIHVMAGNAQGAALADRFTRGSGVGGLFNGLDLGERTDAAAPVVLRDEGVLHVLRCKLLSEDGLQRGIVRVRDHAIVVGEVLEMVPGQGRGPLGLAYADRGYREVGEAIPQVK